MNKNQRITEFQSLVSANHGSIIAAFDSAWSGITSTGEVDRLKDFLREPNKGIHSLNSILPPLFISNGYEVKFASILVHATPIVIPLDNFKKKIRKKGLHANPELGDLDVIFLFLDAAKRVQSARSILYQAKQKRISDTVAINQAHQRYIYETAQGFEYRDGPFAGEARQLPIAGQRRKGLHYLFVSEQPVSCSPIPANSPAYIPWSESMFRFLLDAEGIGIAAGKARGNGWSKIHQDLTHIFRNDQQLRTHNISELASWFNSFKDPNHWHAEADKRSFGVNTMFIIVRDEKLDGSGQSKLKRLRLIRLRE